MAFDATLCNWRVSSEIELTEALPWQGDTNAPIDIHVKFGELPERLAVRTVSTLNSDTSPNGDYLLNFEGVGRYFVSGGTNITVHPECSLDTPDLRLLVQTNCLSVIAWQRDYMPFHGSVVKVGNKTIALVGVSGGGKSTLAMSLVKRGHKFLAEENCITYKNAHDNNSLYVLPTLPDIRLWKDALTELNISIESLHPNRLDQEKYHCPIVESFETAPQPLSAMIVLSQEFTHLTGIASYERLKGADGIGRLGKFIQRRFVGGALGHGDELLNRCLSIVASQRAFRLTSQKGVKNIHHITDTIEDIVAQLPDRDG